ncbi:MAG: Rne/Rng family ribonuclease [Bacteroidetes bacterium]|nr:Rne/Rng family ribonuclease [Bacteroidota bacterium]MBK6818444.1 Rne/Rng family ribonuclease [Bacteroidota bacterium]MBK7588434.1 Rne/Rng family ribonuclease [Bacteroidota bacterium]HQW46478.1 Rne/Rng family ribonuclease [Chitinophagaceae bacterium]
MNKELVIQSIDSGIEIALLEDKKLVELHFDNSGGSFNVGDMYLGKVRKIMPGLNAVFVDIGHDKDAFLHYTDLSPYFKSLLKFTEMAIHDKSGGSFDFSKFQLEPEIVKTGKVADIMQGKPNVLVQILKEPISSKGPRVSCEISLPGRFIVVTPFNNFVNVSRKIHSTEERKRLQKIIESIKPNNFGVIVRTAAEGQSTAELHKDLLSIIESWKSIQFNLKAAKPPFKILSEQNKTTSLLRDLLNKDFNKIVANDKAIVNDAIEYIANVAPGRESIVSFYQNGSNIFDHFGISKQVKSSFGKTVMLDSGGYLIIEHTEALHVIDVNSGHKFSNENQEETAIKTNTEAAKEIARQLRLRDIGGIVVVDFIDMRNPEYRRDIVRIVEELMSEDRAKHSVLPLSKFGLLQITRQRLRPEIKISTGETCPSCEGTGKVRSTQLLLDDIEKHIKYLLANLNVKLELHVHPIVKSHLIFKKGLFGNSIFAKWKKQYGPFEIVEDAGFEFIKYRFFDKNTAEEIKF